MDEDHLEHLLNHEATGAGMGAAAPWQHVVLERGEMKFAGVTFFPHALPARSVEFDGVKVEIWVVSKKSAREEDGCAGRNAEAITEGAILERPALHGV